MNEIAAATVKRIIRRAGGGMRVSESSVRELGEALEVYATKITDEASKLAEHAGRKTIRDTDIRLALKRRE